MHFSSELQTQLNRISSPVKVSATIHGDLPAGYAFLHDGIRQFRAEFASNKTALSIVLYECRKEQKYYYCFARGIFNNMSRLANVVDLWVDKEKTAVEISSQFAELELFKDFEYSNPNTEINYAWMKVKNMFFNDLTFWKDYEWNARYLELLNKAKEHPAFQQLFPITSHYWLRFSVDKDKKESWVFSTYIVPVFYSDEVPVTVGKFYVSYNDKPMGGQFFETADEALDFYAARLREIKPIRWVR